MTTRPLRGTLERLNEFDVVTSSTSATVMSAPRVTLLKACRRERPSNAGNLGYHDLQIAADHVSLVEAEIRLDARDRRGDIRRWFSTYRGGFPAPSR